MFMTRYTRGGEGGLGSASTRAVLDCGVSELNCLRTGSAFAFFLGSCPWDNLASASAHRLSLSLSLSLSWRLRWHTDCSRRAIMLAPIHTRPNCPMDTTDNYTDGNPFPRPPRGGGRPPLRGARTPPSARGAWLSSYGHLAAGNSWDRNPFLRTPGLASLISSGRAVDLRIYLTKQERTRSAIIRLSALHWEH